MENPQTTTIPTPVKGQLISTAPHPIPTFTFNMFPASLLWTVTFEKLFYGIPLFRSRLTSLTGACLFRIPFPDR